MRGDTEGGREERWREREGGDRRGAESVRDRGRY